jgi:MOSC domain-containing protein
VKALGTVAQCWRYPVKSMQGQPRDELSITAAGLDGDRAWALIDVAANRILSAKRTGALLGARASDDAIELPDGSTIALEDPDASLVLSHWLARDVRLAKPRSGEQLAYQMTFDPPNDDAEYFDIPSPEGSFVDLAPLHLVTTATLAGCAKARTDLDWDVRRFRPNLVIDLDGEAFCENDWSGQAIQVGSQVVLDVLQPTVRCAVPLRAQPGLQRQRGLFTALNELNTAFPDHLGVYAGIRTPAPIRVGDPVMLLSD